MTSGDPEPTRPTRGWVAPEVAAEFPSLRLDWMCAEVAGRSSPPVIVARLRQIASRYHGASVVAMRTRPIPHAYRAFYRQIGLDPDVERVPAERAAVRRLVEGGFPSVDLIADACLIALLETAVPVWALDAAVLEPPGPGIRPATAADPGVGPGTLVVADGRRILATLFDDPVGPSAVGPRTGRVALFSLAVDGVPDIHVDEALWVCAELISGKLEY